MAVDRKDQPTKRGRPEQVRQPEGQTLRQQQAAKHIGDVTLMPELPPGTPSLVETYLQNLTAGMPMDERSSNAENLEYKNLLFHSLMDRWLRAGGQR